MMWQPPDRETIFEIGVVSFLVLLVGGIAYLLFGDAIGKLLSGQRRREAPPRPGSVPPVRHGNISAAAAR